MELYLINDLEIKLLKVGFFIYPGWKQWEPWFKEKRSEFKKKKIFGADFNARFILFQIILSHLGAP